MTVVDPLGTKAGFRDAAGRAALANASSVGARRICHSVRTGPLRAP